MNPLAVITGGTKGIGRACIEQFLSGGFDVITCARNVEDLEMLAGELHSKFPASKVTALQADLSQKEEVQKFIDEINLTKRAVEVLINNTGVFFPGQLHNEADGMLEKIIETNLYSAYYLTRGLVSGMIEARKGYIFNICSTASIMAYPNGGSYGISKYALYGMTKTLRQEMKPYNIKVVAVLPGATFTDSWKGSPFPETRFIDPADVASMIWSTYSLSPRAVVEEILIRPQEGDID